MALQANHLERLTISISANAINVPIGTTKGKPMFHHITTNNAPVETFDVSGMSPETYADVLKHMEQAINALEYARIRTDVPNRLHKELGDAILYLIERYEALPNQP